MHDRDLPFDRAEIETMRKKADLHAHEMFEPVPMNTNWLWYARMVATFEKSLEK
jgi:hypothetical protein